MTTISGHPELAPAARQRIEELTERLAVADASPADLRDLSVALVATTAALEDLERVDGQAIFNESRVEAWRDQIRNLLDLVGPVDDRRGDEDRNAARIYYAAREGVLDDLHHALRAKDAEGYEAAPVSEEPGLFDRVRELEEEVESLRVANDQLCAQAREANPASVALTKERS